MTNEQQVPPAVLLRGLLSLAVFMVLLGALLFIPAGGIRWTPGWVFISLFLALTLASIAHLWRANPEIFIARSGIHAGTKGWDKAMVALLLSAFMAEFPVAALDAGRFHWSRVPLWLSVLGYAAFVAGFVLSDLVCLVNKFAEPSVRIQTDRGHVVIDAGPYAVVRHPMYLSAVLMFSAVPFALRSLWALVPAAVALVLLVIRTVLEDKTLHEELEGYREYAARVRHRLLPGVW